MIVPDSLFLDPRYGALEPDSAALLLELLRIQQAGGLAPDAPFKVSHRRIKIKISGYLYGQALKALLVSGLFNRCRNTRTNKPLRNYYRLGDSLAGWVRKEAGHAD